MDAFINALMFIAVFILSSGVGVIVYGLNDDIFFGMLFGLAATAFAYSIYTSANKKHKNEKEKYKWQNALFQQSSL